MNDYTKESIRMSLENAKELGTDLCDRCPDWFHWRL